MIQFLRGAAKAVAAAVAPLLTVLLADVVADLRVGVVAVGAAAVTALTVYLVPNR